MLINIDAKGLEWRSIVELAKDQVALQEILNGEDTHRKNQEYFKFPPGDVGRLVAKIFLFRAIYRGPGYAYANDPLFHPVSSSVKFWDKIIDKLYEKYYAIDRLHQLWASLVAEGQPIVGPSGRQWLIDVDYSSGKLPWTKFTNYPNQGTGADVMCLARVAFTNKLNRRNLLNEVKLVSTVHDSIVVDAPTRYALPLIEVATEVFKELPATIQKCWKYQWDTPLDCEVVVGNDMKNMLPLDKFLKT